MTGSEFTLVSDQIDPYDGRLPNFMIAGEQKAGTSYLHLNLRHHPEVFMTRVKEPLFFSKPNFDSNNVSGYLREHFGTARNERWVGEASASYFHAEKAAPRIKEAFGSEIKFIIPLRHPTEKAVSLYLHNYRRCRLRGDEGLLGVEKTPFPIRKFTSHSKECTRFLDIFGPENVHFLLFDTLRSSPSAFVEGALSFLGLTAVQAPLPRVINKGNDLRWDSESLTIAETELPSAEQVRPRFRKAELELLHESVQEDVERTEQITGLDLSSWKRLPYIVSFLALVFDWLDIVPNFWRDALM
jgi:Sulfotransferase domain